MAIKKSQLNMVWSKVWICFIVLCLAISVPVFSDSIELTEAVEDEILADIPEYDGLPSVDVHGDIPFFQEAMTTAFDGYGPLDEFGRCTIAFACVGLETMPVYPRENISNVHPSGWNDAKYADIDGENLFNRCHLIGFQLTGQNENERNLITGTRYMNIEGMLPYENSIADYVRSTGNHVMYRVTPMYEGDNLIASGVLMEARSVEDPLVQFCVYCYNVQPGIEIDYSTGESFGDNRIDINPLFVDDGTYITENGNVRSDRSNIAEKSQGYVLNTKSKRFHYPYCGSVEQMKESNRKYTEMNRDELLNAGYKPCGDCKP